MTLSEDFMSRLLEILGRYHDDRNLMGDLICLDLQQDGERLCAYRGLWDYVKPKSFDVGEEVFASIDLNEFDPNGGYSAVVFGLTGFCMWNPTEDGDGSGFVTWRQFADEGSPREDEGRVPLLANRDYPYVIGANINAGVLVSLFADILQAIRCE